MRKKVCAFAGINVFKRMRCEMIWMALMKIQTGKRVPVAIAGMARIKQAIAKSVKS